MASGRDTLEVTLRAAAAASSSGSASSVDVGATRRSLRLSLDVTAVTVAGTLTVSVQTSRDGTNWRSLGAFAAASAVGAQELYFGDADRYVRVSWTLTGTLANITFAVTGDAALVYATLADFYRLGLPSEAISALTTSDILGALRAASDEADDIGIDDAYTLPLTAWPDSLRRHVSNLAALTVMGVRGYAPEQGSRDTFKDRRDEAIAWLKMVGQKGASGIVDSTPETNEPAFAIATSTRRGWGGGWP